MRRRDFISWLGGRGVVALGGAGAAAAGDRVPRQFIA